VGLYNNWHRVSTSNRMGRMRQPSKGIHIILFSEIKWKWFNGVKEWQTHLVATYYIFQIIMVQICRTKLGSLGPLQRVPGDINQWRISNTLRCIRTCLHFQTQDEGIGCPSFDIFLSTPILMALVSFCTINCSSVHIYSIKCIPVLNQVPLHEDVYCA
jgi:hypothetical protein